MLRATATMASRRSIDIYALLLTAVLLFHLSRQDSGAARLPPCHSQQHGTVDAPLGPVRASGSDRILLVNEEARCHGIDTSTMAREPAIRVQSSTTAAPTADSSAVPAADAACSTDNPPETESTRHLLQQQVLLYSSNSSSPATAVPEASALAEVLSTFRAGCTSRPAFRMFVPTSVQSTQSTISIVLQLIQPSAALQLWQLFDTSACGTAYNCFLTAQPPAEVIADSLEVSEAEGVGRISIKLPKVGSVLVAASLSLTLKADPCNELGTAANFSVPIYAGAPRVRLQLQCIMTSSSTMCISNQLYSCDCLQAHLQQPRCIQKIVTLAGKQQHVILYCLHMSTAARQQAHRLIAVCSTLYHSKQGHELELQPLLLTTTAVYCAALCRVPL